MRGLDALSALREGFCYGTRNLPISHAMAGVIALQNVHLRYPKCKFLYDEYTMNIASPDESERRKAIDFLQAENIEIPRNLSKVKHEHNLFAVEDD